tara:strand:- start:214 stop:3117 length:2904 start_codon:yes stop_codon:yes gene_type:complete
MATTIQQIELPKKARALDTSGNNNHGQIYSGRGLEFDGIGDSLSLPTELTLVDFSAETTQANRAWTVAAWVNLDSASTAYIQNVIGATANSISYLGIDTNEKLTIYDQTGTAYRTSDTALNANTWYRALWVFNGVDEIAFYLNGVADGTSAMGTTGDDADLQINYIGTRNPSHATATVSRYFTGKMSDLQLWQGAFTAEDASYDYLNPESIVLNRGGTALTESNLKLWYPMQDGHRGQQSYILDGANTGAVSEKIVDGSFANDLDDWTVYGTTSATGGVATIGASSNSGIYQDALTNGLTYSVTINVTSYDGVGNAQVANNNGNVIYTITTAGIQTFTFTHSIASGNLLIRGMSNALFSVSSISVKAINDKHHATTVFYGDEQISATNDRTFAGASNWANAAGANAFNAYDETTSGQLTVTPDDVGDVQYAFLDGAHWEDDDGDGPDMVAGRTYRLSYDLHVSAFTKGTLSVGLSTDAVPAVMTFKNDYTATNGTGASATLDFVYTAATCEMITVYAAANTVLTVDFDNFSLKEVGVASGWTDADQQLHIPQTALQSYNELAWSNNTKGTNNVVATVPHNTDFNPETGDFTVNTWLFLTSSASNDYIIHKGGGGIEGWHININNGAVRFFVRDDPGNQVTVNSGGSSDIVLGKWNMITSVLDYGSTAKVYVNGALLDSVDASGLTGTIAAGTELYLMNYSTGYGRAIDGTTTESSIFKGVAFSQAEIHELYNEGKALDATTHSQITNLKGYWRNNGLSTWTNIHNPGTHDAPLSNGAETILIPQGVDSTRDAQGFIMNRQKSTSCLNLTNGSDSPYVDLGSITTVADDAAASFVMWIKPDDITNNYLLATTSGTDYIRIQNSTNLQLIADSTAATFTVGTITPKDWIHVAFVRAANDVISVYINGVLNGTASTDTETLNEPFDYRYIGGLTSDTFRGQLDGFLIYNDDLTAAEVLKNYKATKGNHRN